MSNEKSLYNALRSFADSVKEKTSQMTIGEPEEQLRGPFENLMAEVERIKTRKIVCTGETLLANRVGKPDYAVHFNKTLAGFVELKAPGIGANPKRFKGHNLEQWKRFQALPNIIYSDGNEWALYRSGKLARSLVRLSGDLTTDGKKAVEEKDAKELYELFTDFLLWEPLIPKGRKGKIDLKEFAAILAPLCRMLRDDVTEALKNPKSPLVELAKDWRKLLFPNADNEQFADAYAQTVTFALLLGRSENSGPLTLESAVSTLSAHHSLLSRALQVLTDPKARDDMSASLDILLRIIAVVPPATLSGPDDPWLYFYEDFLAAYDPKLRKNAGAYYTPVQVVRAQVRLIDELLTKRLNRPMGFADPGVITLDPSAGTGTYLLGVIEHALEKVKSRQGAGAVQGQATSLAKNLYGFEIMVGPYAVTELRVTRALLDMGASLPDDGTHIYLTDTLESPNAKPLELPFFYQPIAEQHKKAIEVKRKVPVIICLGNPPYDRHDAATEDNKASTGGWVRWGDDGQGKSSILHNFIDPAIKAGHGGDIKNLYNLYVYFWRWALWKVFEHETAAGPGVVSFITASSYIDGDAFCGMREHLRRQCDEVWILNLGGEGRGTRKTDNVFAIQTPVAITVAMRKGKAKTDMPAKVHFATIEGSGDDKLKTLEGIQGFASVTWEDCPEDWQAPFRPAGKGAFFEWPLLIDLFPWQHSGVQFKRTWPIGETKSLLKKRWEILAGSDKNDRAKLFRATSAAYISKKHSKMDGTGPKFTEITSITTKSPQPLFNRYAYRSFDRQWIMADQRFCDRPRPSLWQCFSEKQVYLTSLFSNPLGSGPAIMACAEVPDLDHFRGSYGAKAVIPLFLDTAANKSNISPGLLEILLKVYKQKVTPEDFLSYVYGIMAQPAYTTRFSKELESKEVRVPITKDLKLFKKVRDIGARLLWLHTYGDRFVPKGEQARQVPRGKAQCEKAVPNTAANYPETFSYNDVTMTLHVGDGEFKPVSPAVFEFEVSGLKVVRSWLKYRMKDGAGKKSSPLDDIRPERWTSEFTTEFLELLWVLEATVEGYPEQAQLFEAVIKGDCFEAGELPPVPDECRKPPAPPRAPGLFDDFETG